MDAPDKELATIIGYNICKYREQNGMTQAKLAEKVGVGSAFISRIERGEKLMKLVTLYKIALALNVSSDALMYKADDNKHISNIQRLLVNQTPEFIKGVEDMIRTCVKNFGQNDF